MAEAGAYGIDGTIQGHQFTFDADRPDPVVSFRLINQMGKILEEHHYPLSQLTPRK